MGYNKFVCNLMVCNEVLLCIGCGLLRGNYRCGLSSIKNMVRTKRMVKRRMIRSRIILKKKVFHIFFQYGRGFIQYGKCV
jgi:hypothetical protein